MIFIVTSFVFLTALSSPSFESIPPTLHIQHQFYYFSPTCTYVSQEVSFFKSFRLKLYMHFLFPSLVWHFTRNPCFLICTLSIHISPFVFPLFISSHIPYLFVSAFTSFLFSPFPPLFCFRFFSLRQSPLQQNFTTASFPRGVCYKSQATYQQITPTLPRGSMYPPPVQCYIGQQQPLILQTPIYFS